MIVVHDVYCYSLLSSRVADSSSVFQIVVAAAAAAVAAGTVGNYLRPAKFSAQ